MGSHPRPAVYLSPANVGTQCSRKAAQGVGPGLSLLALLSREQAGMADQRPEGRGGRAVVPEASVASGQHATHSGLSSSFRLEDTCIFLFHTEDFSLETQFN